jgi:hypothetical protein
MMFLPGACLLFSWLLNMTMEAGPRQRFLHPAPPNGRSRHPADDILPCVMMLARGLKSG